MLNGSEGDSYFAHRLDFCKYIIIISNYLHSISRLEFIWKFSDLELNNILRIFE